MRNLEHTKRRNPTSIEFFSGGKLVTNQLSDKFQKRKDRGEEMCAV